VKYRSASMIAVALAVCAVAALPVHAHEGSARATTTERASLPIPPWLKNVARHYLTRRVPKAAAKRIFKEWVKSEATSCDGPLPSRYFCPSRPLRWGVGTAMIFNGQGPTTWSSTQSPASFMGRLQPGAAYWLTCWVAGSRTSVGSSTSNLWYRLTNGAYVSDAWMYTGTNYPIPGVARC
jgi:hypothetical protein